MVSTELACALSSLSADYFTGFGKCLGKDEAELGKVWDEALGRYDRAILNLVVDVLQEAENPEEKLCNALNEMRTPESAERAAEAIQNGKVLVAMYCMSFNAYTYMMMEYVFTPQLCSLRNASLSC